MDTTEYILQISTIIKSLLILNTVCSLGIPSYCESDWPSLEQFDFDELLSGRSFWQILGLNYSSLFSMLRLEIMKNKGAEMKCALEDIFRINDLNLGALRTIGKLTIQ